MIIAVDNLGDAPIVLGNECGGRWMGLERDGKPLEWDRTCKCACGVNDRCVCPASCEHTQRLLVPGDAAAEQAWDGVELRFDDPSCYEPAVPEVGEVLQTVVCWNPPDDASDKGTCKSQGITYGDSNYVTVHAYSTPFTARKTVIELENTSGAPVEVVKEICGVQGWFGLKMGSNISLNEFCPCTCDANRDFLPGNCPACGQCAETVYETIPDGGKISFTWDGKFWFKRDACSSRYDMPPTMQVMGEACWRKPGGGPMTCATLPFKPGQSVARASAYTPMP